MKRSKIFILVSLILVVFLSLVIIWPDWWFFRYDHFSGFQRIITSPHLNYKVGDTITIILELRSPEPDKIRIYDDITKSLRLCIRTAIGDNVDITDDNFSSHLSKPVVTDPIKEIEIRPDKPFELRLHGQILPNPESPGVTFKFDKFGDFEKPKTGSFVIWAYWKPINPRPADSLEDFTNMIRIFVEE